MPEPLAANSGAIRFRDVTFIHSGADDALFESFNLSIEPGEKIGLVGHSGSGKTTFTRLLLRFSDIQGGAITIDGQDISQVTQEDLHSVIAYVPQEPLLFHRSIRENIAYEVNTKCNLPAQIDIEATEGAEYRFIMVAKGGGSANKTYFYPMTKATIQNEKTLLPFLQKQC